LITREQGSGTRITIERVLGMKFNSEIEINSNEAIIEAVQAGLGIGFVSKHTVKLELENSIIKQLNIDKFPITRHWHTVHSNKTELLNPALALLGQGLKKSPIGQKLDFANHPYLCKGLVLFF
jgi:DNA-binding transcriptional LysR family regulator